MNVYIEYVIIDNLVINYVLLYLSLKTVKAPIRKWRICLSAGIGTAVAVMLPLINWGNIVLMCIKILLSLVMVLIVSLGGKRKKFIVTYTIFIVYTFVLGGAIIGMFYLTNTPFLLDGTINYIGDIPIGIFILAGVVVAYFGVRLYLYVSQRHIMNTFIAKVGIIVFGQTFNVEGYLDSGNSLLDEVNLKPVCFISDNNFRCNIMDLIAKQTMMGKSNVFHYVSYNTVAGNSRILCVDATVQLKLSKYDISLAIDSKLQADYQLILNNFLIGEGDNEFSNS